MFFFRINNDTSFGTVGKPEFLDRLILQLYDNGLAQYFQSAYNRKSHN